MASVAVVEQQVRAAVPADEDDVARLAVVTGLFTDDDLPGLLEAFRDAAPPDQWWVVTVGGAVVAAAYVAPEPFSDRLWNLYFLAVDPEAHGRGLGSLLVVHVEEQLRALGEQRARVLLVETSGTEQYAGTRGFYVARGFDEEARIREFYGPGDDKVVFWKALRQVGGPA